MDHLCRKARQARRAVFALVVALLALLVVAACTAPPAAPTAPPLQAELPTAAVAAPSRTAPPAAAAPARTAAPTVAVKVSDLPAGVNADGNFYRGDPNASVKLTEWSDFQ